MQIPKGARCLLIGSNGAGKTTLLNILGGKHMHDLEAVSVCGQPAFHDTHPGISIISGNWSHTQPYGAHSVPYTKDIPVREMLEMAPEKHPERAEVLIKTLDVDLDWRMHKVSDGQRRRVQLLLGLLKPFEVLLIDEVTVDLDVVARSNLLRYLQDECESRGASIVYATHIFDGLERWATHFARLSAGRVLQYGATTDFSEYQKLLETGCTSPLLKVVLSWLMEEEEKRGGKSAEGELRAEFDLKLNAYSCGNPFAHNRMHNRTC